MKIEIWSDVVCPFCYIGKRKLEKALSNFPNKGDIEIEWKSFQLNPDQKTNPSLNTIEYLATSKGWTMEQTREITSNVVEMAKTEGLEFDFDNAVVANTKNAHRLIHHAKSHGKGGEMKERLLSAYFSEGKNIDDAATLTSLGKEIGLADAEIKRVLESNQYEEEVELDSYESRQMGVRGVPFFVLDRKYAISGAQPDEVFTQTLEKSWNEYLEERKAHGILTETSGDTCEVDGDC